MTNPDLSKPTYAEMEELDRLTDQMAQFDTDLQQSTRRSLIIWAIRWLIGFGLIWTITAWTGTTPGYGPPVL
ncbi:hypothetical protein [Halovulum sp. GXIMD14793]